MGYTPNPFNYTGDLPNEVEHDLNLANDNFNTLAQAFVNNDPTTGTVKNADKVDGYHASQTPQANTIPVAGSNGKLDADWLPSAGNLNKVEFLTSGSWVVPASVSKILVVACAGGGGGGAGSTYGGEGGFPGNSTVSVLTVSPGETLSITVGAGGAGGSVYEADGGNGGDTIISGSVSGTILQATGGIGGRSRFSCCNYGMNGQSSFFGRGGRGSITGSASGEDAPRPGAGGGGGYGDPNYIIWTKGGSGGSGYVRIIYLS